MMKNFKIALVSYDAPEIPSWVIEEIEKTGSEFVYQQCQSADEVVGIARDADFVWVFGCDANTGKILHDTPIEKFERCAVIMRTGSGTDNIPVPRATELGIIVANTPQATCEAVSEHAIALLLALCRKVVEQNENTKNKIWDHKAAGFPLKVQGRTLGLVGFGHIPRQIVQKLQGFELNILAHDPYLPEEAISSLGARPATLDEVLSESDFVSLHCPLTEGTRHIINEAALKKMKPHAILINTARGPIVDEKALYKALSEGWIGGAGLDVVETIPGQGEQPLSELANVILTPHSAGYLENHLENFWKFSVMTVIDVANGKMPSSYVNRDVKPRFELTAV